jgi:hypothetical protein
MCPLLTERLGKNVNLDGHFLINCNFSNKDKDSQLFENLIVAKIQQ